MSSNDENHEKKKYLQDNLNKIIMDNSIDLDIMSEYLLSFEIDNYQTEMKQYLIEVIGIHKKQQINTLITSYYQKFYGSEVKSQSIQVDGNSENKSLSTSIDKKSATKSYKPSTTSVEIPLKDTTKVVKDNSKKIFANPIMLPSGNQSKHNPLSIINQIGIKKTNKVKSQASKSIAVDVVKAPVSKQCGCFATKHNYIASCTSCGRIYCEIEGPISNSLSGKSQHHCYLCQGIVLGPVSYEDVISSENYIIDNDDSTLRAYKHKVSYNRSLVSHSRNVRPFLG